MDKILEIFVCVGLLYDMGNLLFGYFGEESICEWFCDNLVIIIYKNKSLVEILIL